ncbi:MAG TPA: methanogenesis marker 12 protein [Methanomicrobiales archaeon]|jgi:putative methanogenesis marker protein 12|nr:methanogenesis marker 12 protein [Methanomicrobiales archaeon]
MFIGIDHGTTAIRFSSGERDFKVPRKAAVDFALRDLERLGPLGSIEGIALTYSMGDNFSEITPISLLENRGLVSREGAGEHIGGGTRIFDAIRESRLPAVAIPGLHRGSPTDPRFKAYSHQASPEKIGIAYEVSQALGDDFVVSDVSSNTVTILVTGGKIRGAIDACIFAPGTTHGAIDVDAIRRIDRGKITANRAFTEAGVDFTMPEGERMRTLALFAAMECAALRVLSPGARVALAGSCAPAIAGEVEALLGEKPAVYDEWCASRGLARIARDVFSGKREILGIGVRR